MTRKFRDQARKFSLMKTKFLTPILTKLGEVGGPTSKL